MIVPFTRTGDSAAPIQPATQMPSQSQLLMAAAEMHQKGLLGGQPEPDTPDTKTMFQKLDETKPVHKRGRR